MKEFFKKYKDIIVFTATSLFCVLFIFVGYKICQIPIDDNSYDALYYSAVITKITGIETNSYSLSEESRVEEKTISFEANITSKGVLEGITVKATQNIDDLLAVNPKEVEVNDKILLSYVDYGDGNGLVWQFAEYKRSDGLLILLLLFFVLLLIFGRAKGFRTVISLVVTCLAVFLIFIPSVIKGYNAYISSIIISVFVVFTTLILLNGLNKKTFCSIIGNISGIAAAGIITLIMNTALKLTGVVDEQSIFLVMLNENKPIDLIAIIFAAVIIGALGATMDVAMSISSALYELSEKMENKSFKSLFMSGLNIGRDMIGTMANTLILAYIGSALSTVILIYANNRSILSIFNREMIVVEVLQALSGSIGILATLPLTALLASYMYNKKDKSKIKN